ncbi:MAG: sugar ABC transporter permease [Deltaproteobacteria bacterium]|nr:sugar ABC transporter permease [Deltaproteobacteria bacterium]MBT7205291.1 sugar ABC transporter permease [Deltaproteobacteria bacterium]
MKKENFAAYIFLLPWLVGFFLLTIQPIVSSFYLSLTEYDTVSDPYFIGFEHYEYMFVEDYRFWEALKVTFFYVAVGVPFKLGFALAIALWLNQGVQGLSLYRAVFYLPSLLGSSVAVGILWRQVFHTDGLVNYLLAFLGISGPSWLSDPDTSIYTVILLTIWQFGSPMLIFLAGLRQIPHDLYEASSIDGASKFRQFWKITLPLLAPVIFFNLVLQTIDAFKTFNNVFIISGGNGSPVDSLLFYTLYLYQQGFEFFRMGYASALAWVLLIIISIFTAIYFYTSKYWVYYESEK